MRKLLMIGTMLSIASCNPATIKEPIDSTFINFDLGVTRSGPVNFDYKTKNREDVGTWADIDQVRNGTIEDLEGTYYCQKVDDFAKTVIPTLRKGHDQYYDWINSKNN